MMPANDRAVAADVGSPALPEQQQRSGQTFASAEDYLSVH
jgi:hypothetical protein